MNCAVPGRTRTCVAVTTTATFGFCGIGGSVVDGEVVGSVVDGDGDGDGDGEGEVADGGNTTATTGGPIGVGAERR